jgi:hypothetical protein
MRELRYDSMSKAATLANMTALSDHLQLLLGLVRDAGLQPSSSDVRIVEVRNDQIDPRSGKVHVSLGDLRPPSDYESRFDELLSMGYAWMNLSCYGVCKNFLIVVVELSSTKSSELDSTTSVNLSGPARIVVDHGWNADAVLTIE